MEIRRAMARNAKGHKKEFFPNGQPSSTSQTTRGKRAGCGIGETLGKTVETGVYEANDNNNNTLKYGDFNLVCFICRKEYRNPKLLPCLHTFCKHCVKTRCVERGEYGVFQIRCPLCFSVQQMVSAKFGGSDATDEYLEDLASDFTALNMLDAKALMMKSIEDTSVCESCRSASEEGCRAQAVSRCSECALFLCLKCQRAHRVTKTTKNHNVISFALLDVHRDKEAIRINFCPSHTGEEMTYYCETCDCNVCDDCTFLDHPKTTHDLVTLSDATTTHRRQLAELLSNVRRKLPFLKRTLLHVDSVLQAVPDHADAVAREIARNTETCIHALKQRQEQLLDDLTKLCLHKTRVLQEQKGRIQSELQVSVANCQTTENILRTGSDSEISSVHSLVYERMRVLDEMMVDIEADENAEFNYESGEAALTDAIHDNGKVHRSPTLGSPLRAIGDGLQNAAAGKFAMFTLAKSKHSVSPGDIDVRIETPDSVLLACDVKQSSSLYTVSYCPRVPGEHEISVAFRGEHLPDSPVCVNVKTGHMVCPEAQAHCLVIGGRGNSPGCFDRVCDVAVRSNGNILSVDSFNNRVQTFNSNGSFISQFGVKGEGLGRLLYPTGLAISHEGHVIVTEHGNHRVQMFTSDGAHLSTFGGPGNDNGLMDHPTGIAVDEEGQLVVVDQHNHRVQVFDSSGHFKYQFGCYGKQDGEFNRPMFVAINQDGEIFVTDSGNHRVQIFDEGGRFRRAFGQPGTDDGEFYCPTGVTIDACGYVIVSDKSNKIQVFTSELDFVTKLDTRGKGGKLDCPMGLDYTPEGRIVVADQGNANVKVFYT